MSCDFHQDSPVSNKWIHITLLPSNPFVFFPPIYLHTQLWGCQIISRCMKRHVGPLLHLFISLWYVLGNRSSPPPDDLDALLYQSRSHQRKIQPHGTSHVPILQVQIHVFVPAIVGAGSCREAVWGGGSRKRKQGAQHAGPSWRGEEVRTAKWTER